MQANKHDNDNHTKLDDDEGPRLFAVGGTAHCLKQTETAYHLRNATVIWSRTSKWRTAAYTDL